MFGSPSPLLRLVAALRLNMELRSDALLRSDLSSCVAVCFTDSMPFKAPPFDVYRSLLRMVSPFPAFRTKWNCPGGEFLSTYLPAIFLLPEWMSTPAQPRAQGLAKARGHFPHAGWLPLLIPEIGSASCSDRVCKYM